MRIEVFCERFRSLFQMVTCLMVGFSSAMAQPSIGVYAPPEGATIFDGNSYATPFDTAGRFQQVYDASIFSSSPWLPEGRGFIRFLIFNTDADVGHSFRSTLPSVQLNLSTTLKSADGLSSVFDDNVGGNGSVVLGPRAILFSVAGGGGSFVFNFRDNPFYYDSSQGNLLVDFRIHEGFNPPGPTLGEAILDAFTAPGDPISSVYAQGSSSLTSGQISTLGLATEIIFTPVPKLAVSLQSTNLLITWPLLRVDFKLEQSPVMEAGASWHPAGGIITTNRTPNGTDDIETVLPMDRKTTARFFRLVSQPSSPSAAGPPLNNDSSVLSNQKR